MLHIGKEIKKKAKELRVGPTELARLINVSKQNVYHIFERKSLDTDQLEMISKALNFDFFQLYYIHEHEENFKVNADRIMLEQSKRIKDQERTISVLTGMVEELKVKYGLEKESNNDKTT